MEERPWDWEQAFLEVIRGAEMGHGAAKRFRSLVSYIRFREPMFMHMSDADLRSMLIRIEEQPLR